MESRSLKFIADACGGLLKGGDPNSMIRNVCTDSRQIQRGDLFLALKGDRFDGHDYLSEVAIAGAAAVIVDRKPVVPHLESVAVIEVSDTKQALGKLAAAYRHQFQLPLIAVAGSNGKTTTKDLLATLLAEKLSVLSSAASFNNDIGVPLTLLKLEQHHKTGVLEVGTNHPGELAPLVKMVAPQFGIITSIGREHMEFFGSLAGVAEEEGWLAELLPTDGKLFVNGDSPEMEAIIRRTRAQVISTGFGAANEWQADDIFVNEHGITFSVACRDPFYAGAYSMRLFGRHQVSNALLAIAVAREFGLSRDEIQRGLAKCQASKMRLQLWTARDVQVLDDSYNANADSMRAALQTLQDFPCSGRRIAVLGDMAELGEHGADAHSEVGRCAVEAQVQHLFAVGSMAGRMAEAARGAGLESVGEFGDVEAAAAAVKAFVRPGDVVLLKASRATRLERIGSALRSSNEFKS